MYFCVYVCACERGWMCLCMCVWAWMNVFMYVRVSVDECVYVCACEFADTSVHECGMCVSFGSLSLLVLCLNLDR